MNSLSEILLENGREALQLAIHEDRYKGDSYRTKVICDGGWNKCRKAYDYSAQGCVAVIIDAFAEIITFTLLGGRMSPPKHLAVQAKVFSIFKNASYCSNQTTLVFQETFF